MKSLLNNVKATLIVFSAPVLLVLAFQTNQLKSQIRRYPAVETKEVSVKKSSESNMKKGIKSFVLARAY